MMVPTLASWVVMASVPCADAVRLSGSAADVVGRALSARGVSWTDAAGCAAAAAHVTARGQSVAVELSRSTEHDGEAASKPGVRRSTSRREVTSIDVAVVLIEAWVRRDLSAALLRPPRAGGAAVAKRAAPARPAMARAVSSSDAPSASGETAARDVRAMSPARIRDEAARSPAPAAPQTLDALAVPLSATAAHGDPTPAIAPAAPVDPTPAPTSAHVAQVQPTPPRAPTAARDRPDADQWASAPAPSAWSVTVSGEVVFDEAAEVWWGARARLSHALARAQAHLSLRMAGGSTRHAAIATATDLWAGELLVGAGLPLSASDWSVEPIASVGARLLARSRGQGATVDCGAERCGLIQVPDALVSTTVSPAAELALLVRWRASSAWTLESSVGASFSPWAAREPLLPGYAASLSGEQAQAFALAPESLLLAHASIGLRWTAP